MTRQIPRRLFLGASAVAMPGIIAARGDTPEIQLKLGNNRPATHPVSVRQKEAANRIQDETNGRVNLTIYPDNQLGSDSSMITQLRGGSLDFMTVSGLVFSTVVPITAIAGLGYAFNNYAAIWAAMDGALGRLIGTGVERYGVHLLEKIWDSGFRQISSATHPIRVPADLKGFKLRVPISPLVTSMFLAFNAEPLNLNFAELDEALKTGAVEGQENTLISIETGALYKVQKYVSMTKHMWDPFLMLANGKVWDGLPSEVRDVVAKNLNAAAEDQRLDVANSENTIRRKLQQAGMIFNDPDQEPFRKVLVEAGFYDAWKTKFGNEAWGILEKYTGKIVS